MANLTIEQQNEIAEKTDWKVLRSEQIILTIIHKVDNRVKKIMAHNRPYERILNGIVRIK